MESKKIIDLTYHVTSEMLVFPNTERPTFSWKGRVNSEGFNLTRMSMLVHTGTHVDSPLHFLADGKPIDELPLDLFYGKTRIYRVKDGARGQAFTAENIEPSIDTIEKGSIFVIDTGVGKYRETADYNRLYPYPSTDLVRKLIEMEIRCYMTDATAVDPVVSENSEIHKQLFLAGIPIVENLANLDKVPNGKDLIISALPLKLAGREGAPCRAVAIFE
ncbi:MAG: cyclase family protein [Chitinispirillaceae bacterium]|nr:cyclase family protein [Chitinispirillaceae bacterium]